MGILADIVELLQDMDEGTERVTPERAITLAALYEEKRERAEEGREENKK